jgi:hypothetical protein
MWTLAAGLLRITRAHQGNASRQDERSYVSKSGERASAVKGDPRLGDTEPGRRAWRGLAFYFALVPASVEMPAPEESVLPGTFAGGDVAVPSELMAGVSADPLDDWSEFVGAAGIVPVEPVESELDWVPGAWPGADEPTSGLVAADESVSELAAVWADAATDDSSAPAAKKGTSLVLSVIDVSPVVRVGR